MKTRPKESLSPLQRKRLVRIIVVAAVLAILWVFFAPNMGIVPVHREKQRLEKLEMRKAELKKENDMLLEEIDRLQNDLEYFERMAREKHGLLKKNEMIFDFSKEEKQKE